MSVISRAKQLAPPIIYRLTNHIDSFLSQVDGVIHVGANTGQERFRYKQFGLRVIWIEPIPWVFAQLVENIRGFGQQVALEALVTNVDGATHLFHVANNEGESSSILDLKDHRRLWPEVKYSQDISLSSITLPSLLNREGYESRDYQALILDTQGSEMLVLEGSVPILEGFTFIKTEVADFEAYEGCCQISEVSAFLEAHGFQERKRVLQATLDEVGNYFEILYEKLPR